MKRPHEAAEREETSRGGRCPTALLRLGWSGPVGDSIAGALAHVGQITI